MKGGRKIETDKPTSNRTSVELKRLRCVVFGGQYSLLIEPVWN